MTRYPGSHSPGLWPQVVCAPIDVHCMTGRGFAEAGTKGTIAFLRPNGSLNQVYRLTGMIEKHAGSEKEIVINTENTKIAIEGKRVTNSVQSTYRVQFAEHTQSHAMSFILVWENKTTKSSGVQWRNGKQQRYGHHALCYQGIIRQYNYFLFSRQSPSILHWKQVGSAMHLCESIGAEQCLSFNRHSPYGKEDDMAEKFVCAKLDGGVCDSCPRRGRCTPRIFIEEMLAKHPETPIIHRVIHDDDKVSVWYVTINGVLYPPLQVVCPKDASDIEEEREAINTALKVAVSLGVKAPTVNKAVPQFERHSVS